ncbi:MAG: outer membrane protein assembly factor BamD [Gammaproteobacteria bacterium]|nr:outer membrane protein assembly factor BamD [Gammaproteobacteria bacterium]
MLSSGVIVPIIYKILPVLLVCLLFSGCAGNRGSQNDSEFDEGITETELHERAQRALLIGNYVEAIEQLELLESYFPFGRSAEQAQLELIYANYMRTDYDSAILAADRFINLHPQHQNVDYAYYMKGLSSFQRDRGFFDILLGTPEPLRDISGAKEAFTLFAQFLNQFPDSIYAKDAQLRMYHLRNVMAESELAIAVFYLQRDTWLSAVTRAREVIEHYPRTEVIPFALVVLVEANHRLGLTEARDDALEVLARNFPDYQGFNEDGELVIKPRLRNKDRSILNTLTFGLLDKPQRGEEIRLKPRVPIR